MAATVTRRIVSLGSKIRPRYSNWVTSWICFPDLIIEFVGLNFAGECRKECETRSPAGLSWCMRVCVRGVKEDLGAGLFFYSIFYLISILLVPSLFTILYILLLVFYLLWPKSYMQYSILYLVSIIFNIVYVHSVYMLCLRF